MPELEATKREDLGTRKVRRLRKQGLIPGVIYGHGKPVETIAMSEHEFHTVIGHGERLLAIKLGGKKHNVLIKDVQYDTYGKHILHVDLTRVNLDERVEVTVSITLKGTPVGVSEEGGMLQQIASEARIECPVRSIPEDIPIQVGDLRAGNHLSMSDLPLPAGSKLLSDPSAPVASVRMVAEEVEPETTEEGEVAQPEVIGEAEQAEEDETDKE